MKQLLLTLLASSTANALAAEPRSMDAHVHGVSTFELAIEDHLLEMRLTSPGMDIVGFEYAASSEADQTAVDAAIRALVDPDSVVTLPVAAECRLREVFAHLHTDEHGAHEDHEDHDHDEHADHKDHDHGEHEKPATTPHSEFEAGYTFACAHPEALTHVDFPFFAQFTTALEIEAQYVTGTGQGFAEIERDTATLTLK